VNPTFERYLSDFNNALSRVEPAERQDALREIESHFADAAAAGASPAEVVARLGSPRLLAAALRAEGLNKRDGATVRQLLRVIVTSLFIAGSSLTSLVLVPILAVIAVGFGLIAVLSPFAGALRTFGASWIQINVLPGQSLPVEWSLPFMLAVGLCCGLIALCAYKGLRLYIRVIARGYRAVLGKPSGLLPA
jgi:uncharacterized membrane protein